jgi:hypothetical protein
MSTKRTDKILELLDATLQSTTRSGEGMPVGNPNLCVCCQQAIPIEGRSWCAACLPEESDDVTAASPYSLWYHGPDEDQEDDDEDDDEALRVTMEAIGAELAAMREAGMPPPAMMTIHADDGTAIGYAVDMGLLALLGIANVPELVDLVTQAVSEHLQEGSADG